MESTNNVKKKSQTKKYLIMGCTKITNWTSKVVNGAKFSNLQILSSPKYKVFQVEMLYVTRD
jgi:hypothetical protein